MSDKENIDSKIGALPTILESINLPSVLGGAAGVAISRLIGGVIDYPIAWFDRASQAVRDKTTAKSIVNDALANSVALQLSNDPELVQRAKNSFLTSEFRKQINRESVAQKTIEHLAEQPAVADAVPIEDDWLDYFSSYAEKANSEKLRDLWARILAGEIRKSNSFGLATLRFMAELDTETAQIIEKYFTRTFSTLSIIHRATYGKSPDLTEVTLMENLGLLNGLGETRNRTLRIEDNGFLFLNFQKHAVVIQAEAGKEIVLNCLLLTKLGREVLSILTLDDDIEEGKAIASILPKEGITKISWYPIQHSEGRVAAMLPETKLWEPDQV
jgi:Protein of unknown function (DUF2806)